ncbi:hypothetical protein CVT24_007030 [Panaeolus cyanescens]|uniref:Uncharacterized protein n=1 Tax=Panaeolus cyanescens TaxID=181874 RepID=A0A409YKE7_9AGAR|nr:hypothetical protein CVT24_007030 [Panaeolus cyanescens]
MSSTTQPICVPADQPITVANSVSAPVPLTEVSCSFECIGAIDFSVDVSFSPTREFVCNMIKCIQTCTTRPLQWKSCRGAFHLLVSLHADKPAVLHYPGLVELLKEYYMWPTSHKVGEVKLSRGTATVQPDINEQHVYSILRPYTALLEQIYARSDEGKPKAEDVDIANSIISSLPDLFDGVLALPFDVFQKALLTELAHEHLPRILCLANRLRQSLALSDSGQKRQLYKMSDSMIHSMLRFWVLSRDQINDCCLSDLAEALQGKSYALPTNIKPVPPSSNRMNMWISDKEAIDLLKVCFVSSGSGETPARFRSLVHISLGMLQHSDDFIQRVVDSQLHIYVINSLGMLQTKIPQTVLLESFKLVDLFFSDCYERIKDSDAKMAFVSALKKIYVGPSDLAEVEISSQTPPFLPPTIQQPLDEMFEPNFACPAQCYDDISTALCLNCAGDILDDMGEALNKDALDALVDADDITRLRAELEANITQWNTSTGASSDKIVPSSLDNMTTILEIIVYGLFLLSIAAIIGKLAVSQCSEIKEKGALRWSRTTTLIAMASALFGIAIGNLMIPSDLLIKLSGSHKTFGELVEKLHRMIWLLHVNSAVTAIVLVYRCYGVWGKKKWITYAGAVGVLGKTAFTFTCEGMDAQQLIIYASSVDLAFYTCVMILIAAGIFQVSRQVAIDYENKAMQYFQVFAAILLESGLVIVFARLSELLEQIHKRDEKAIWNAHASLSRIMKYLVSQHATTHILLQLQPRMPGEMSRIVVDQSRAELEINTTQPDASAATGTWRGPGNLTLSNIATTVAFGFHLVYFAAYIAKLVRIERSEINRKGRFQWSQMTTLIVVAFALFFIAIGNLMMTMILNLPYNTITSSSEILEKLYPTIWVARCCAVWGRKERVLYAGATVVLGKTALTLAGEARIGADQLRTYASAFNFTFHVCMVLLIALRMCWISRRALIWANVNRAVVYYEVANAIVGDSGLLIVAMSLSEFMAQVNMDEKAIWEARAAVSHAMLFISTMIIYNYAPRNDGVLNVPAALGPFTEDKNSNRSMDVANVTSSTKA